MIHNHLAADPLPRMKCALVLCLLFLFPFEGTPYVYETCLSMLQLFQQYCSREGYSIGCPSTKKKPRCRLPIFRYQKLYDSSLRHAVGSLERNRCAV
ncbi:hypothetical protein L596_016845 [Steinernema carpocapsae]|uniref:FZ domain-containing protein n=1 Tax=Steinernema carpocapsae TaxID=34508 RepID=A0A4U5NKR4_STECR|nr:hypothetical protein L596_016845 [Steinernema carpocapsae]